MDAMRVVLLMSLLITWVLPRAYAQSQTLLRRARVAVPVADLRQEPSKSSGTLEQDPLEESQLLYGDPVEVLEEKEGWARVLAVEQPEWSHNKRWEGYPGWIEQPHCAFVLKQWDPNLVVTSKFGKVFSQPNLSAPVRLTLSFATRLAGRKRGNVWELDLLDGTTGWISNSEVISLEGLSDIQKYSAAFRTRLVESARLFLGNPYSWGGRSSDKIDCSGLVGLAYQANGLHIPRDAHEIWMLSRPIEPKNLLAGDLIFLHDPEDPNRIVHVMLYAGDNRVIEAPGTGLAVREMDLKERLKEVKSRRVSFGTYLP